MTIANVKVASLTSILMVFRYAIFVDKIDYIFKAQTKLWNVDMFYSLCVDLDFNWKTDQGSAWTI